MPDSDAFLAAYDAQHEHTATPPLPELERKLEGAKSQTAVSTGG